VWLSLFGKSYSFIYCQVATDTNFQDVELRYALRIPQPLHQIILLPTPLDGQPTAWFDDVLFKVQVWTFADALLDPAAQGFSWMALASVKIVVAWFVSRRRGRSCPDDSPKKMLSVQALDALAQFFCGFLTETTVWRSLVVSTFTATAIHRREGSRGRTPICWVFSLWCRLPLCQLICNCRATLSWSLHVLLPSCLLSFFHVRVCLLAATCQQNTNQWVCSESS